MLQKILVIAGLVLGLCAAFTFTPFDGISVAQEAGAGVAALGVALLL